MYIINLMSVTYFTVGDAATINICCNTVCTYRQWRTQEFCSGGGGGVQQIQLGTEERENGDLGGSSPLVRGSGGSCNLVQEISFHTVEFS